MQVESISSEPGPLGYPAVGLFTFSAKLNITDRTARLVTRRGQVTPSGQGATIEYIDTRQNRQIEAGRQKTGLVVCRSA